MEENQDIIKNLDSLKLGTCNVAEFIDRLHIHNVIDAEIKNLLIGLPDPERIDDVYQHLLTKSSDMTPLICNSLVESGNKPMAELLKAHKQFKEHYSMSPNQPMLLRYNEGNAASRAFYNQKQDVDEVDYRPMNRNFVKHGIERLDRNPPVPFKAYKMGSKPKGYVLIINIEEFINDVREQRLGSQEDVRNLISLFTDLGYDVEVLQNLGKDEMLKVIKEFSTHPKHANVDSCIVFIMSHGETEARDKFINIICSDSQSINTLDVINNFIYPQTSVFGTEKPIIFFFQACRGFDKDFGRPRPVTRSSSEEEEVQQRRPTTTDGWIQNKSDRYQEYTKGRKYDHILIVNACVPGHVSLRDEVDGAWFVETICKIFRKHAWEYDIDTMLSMVDDEIRTQNCSINGMQTTTVEKWGFTRKFFFNPGLYDEDVEGGDVVISPVRNTNFGILDCASNTNSDLVEDKTITSKLDSSLSNRLEKIEIDLPSSLSTSEEIAQPPLL